MGIARVQIRRVVTLDDQAMSALGTSREEVTTEDYTLPQRLGRALFEQGAGAIAVPAAIAAVVQWFPEMRVERGLSTLTIATPRSVPGRDPGLLARPRLSAGAVCLLLIVTLGPACS